MKVVVAAPDELWEELSTTLNKVDCIRVQSASEFTQHNSADVFFDLFAQTENAQYLHDALIFINSPLIPLIEYNHHKNVVRLNCWKGFLIKNKWEIAGSVNEKVSVFFSSIGKEVVVSPDIPGFMSCRIISMIINEAYLTLDEGVSTKEEIDIAMKLGTNYPKGPFEWSREIGINNVLKLLTRLSEDDERYVPAPLLVKESTEA